MSTASSMFLTLTPSMHQMDSSSHVPESFDEATSRFVADSLSYHFDSGLTPGPLASSLEIASVNDKASIHQDEGAVNDKATSNQDEGAVNDEAPSNQDEGSFTEQNKAMHSVSVASISEDDGAFTEQNKAMHSVSVASISQENGTFTEKNKAIPSVSVSEVSVESGLDDANLPAILSTNHDAVTAIRINEFLSPATVLKRRLERTKDLIVCPGVYDGFSARIALSVGFDALYMVSNIDL